MAKNKYQPGDDVVKPSAKPPPPEQPSPGQAAHIHPNQEPHPASEPTRDSETDPVTLADRQDADAGPAADSGATPGAKAASGPPAADEEAAVLREQLLRATADFENYKRRARSEQDRAVELARTGVILSLVPVIDNFERAFKTVPEAVAADPWYGGVQAIKQQFESVIADLGIERITTVGEPFDPNLHEAITTEPSDEHGDNIVSEEFEAGYRLGDEVIRHARVKVSSGKA